MSPIGNMDDILVTRELEVKIRTLLSPQNTMQISVAVENRSSHLANSSADNGRSESPARALHLTLTLTHQLDFSKPQFPIVTALT